MPVYSRAVNIDIFACSCVVYSNNHGNQKLLYLIWLQEKEKGKEKEKEEDSTTTNEKDKNEKKDSDENKKETEPEMEMLENPSRVMQAQVNLTLMEIFHFLVRIISFHTPLFWGRLHKSWIALSHADSDFFHPL